MRNNKTFGIGGKGYYIALVLCAAAIGITGYVYRTSQKKVEQVSLLETQEVALRTGETTAAATEQPETKGTAPSRAETQPPQTQATVPSKPLKTGLPVQGSEAAVYSMDALSYNETTRDWRVHNGVDYGAEAGTPVLAAADGTVTAVKEDDLMGCTLVLRHSGGYETTYYGLAQMPELAVGETVELGEQIGEVGTSALAETALGPHVHFSVTYQDMPMNPGDFLKLG